MQVDAQILGFIVAGFVLVPPVIWLTGIVRWRLTGRRAGARYRRVSVIVAGRNEEQYVEACLESLTRLDYPRELLEVLFVDDHSNDSTIELASGVARRDALIQVLNAPSEPVWMGPKKRALCHAIAHSQGEFLFFTDADNRVPPEWLRAMLDEYDAQTGAVIGAALPAGGTPGKLLYRLERSMVMLTTASPLGWGSPASACGQNLSIRREVFEAIGGYAHAELPSGDDDLLMQAVARAGYKVRFARAPESVVLDTREPDAKTQLQAAARHQSVTKFYPLRWRLLYAGTIVSFAGNALLLIGELAYGALLPAALSAIAGSALLYFVAAKLFAKQLHLRMEVAELLLGLLLLPGYILLRPLFRVRKTLSWRGRPMKMAGCAR